MTINASKLIVFVRKASVPVDERSVPACKTSVPVHKTAVPVRKMTVPEFEIAVPACKTIVPACKTIVPVREITIPARKRAVNTFKFDVYPTKFLKFAAKFNKQPYRRNKKMTDEEINEFNSAVMMIDYKTAHPNVFKDNAKMTGGFAALEADIAVLEAAGANRLSASGARSDGTIDKRAAKADLYALVRKTIETAKLIKKEEPDFDNTFKIPRGSLSGPQLLDSARSFANDLTPALVAKFGEFGAGSVKPDNFNTKITTYETARTHQNTGKTGSVAATAETRAASARLKKNRRTVAQIGENILEESDDAGLLAAWKSACHVEKRRKSDKAGTDGNPIPTP